MHVLPIHIVTSGWKESNWSSRCSCQRWECPLSFSAGYHNIPRCPICNWYRLWTAVPTMISQTPAQCCHYAQMLHIIDCEDLHVDCLHYISHGINGFIKRFPCKTSLWMLACRVEHHGGCVCNCSTVHSYTIVVIQWQPLVCQSQTFDSSAPFEKWFWEWFANTILDQIRWPWNDFCHSFYKITVLFIHS